MEGVEPTDRNTIKTCLKRVKHKLLKKEMCRFAEDMRLETHCIHQRVGNLNLLDKLNLKASLSSGETILFVNWNNPRARTVLLVKYGPPCFIIFHYISLYIYIYVSIFAENGLNCRVDQVWKQIVFQKTVYAK